MKRTIAAVALATAVGSAAACSSAPENGNARSANAPASNPAPSNASATAGTAPTFEPGSAQYIAANQPDYSANVTVQTGPTKLEGRVVKIGEAWRIESTFQPIGKTITFVRPGQSSIMIFADKKQYMEDPNAVDINPVTRTLQGLQQPGVRFEQIGTEVVDGRATTKYRGTKEGENGELVLYAAPDLKNMIVKIDGKKENVTFSATWTDINPNPPADAVQPPPDLTTAYKKIDPGEFQSMFSSGGGSDATGSTTPPPAPPAAVGKRP